MAGLGRQMNSSHDFLGFVFMLHTKLYAVVPKAIAKGVRVSDENAHMMVLIARLRKRFLTRTDWEGKVTYRGIYTHYEEEERVCQEAANWLTRLGAEANSEPEPEYRDYDVSSWRSKQLVKTGAYELVAERVREMMSTDQREGQ